MNVEQSLDSLKDKANTLEKEVRDNDLHIDRWVRALANGEDPGRAIEGLQDYQNRQLGLMFELGKTEAKIEDLENRIREEADHEREQVLAQDFAEGQPVAQEDYLDWIRPALDAPVPAEEHSNDERHPHYEGEDRMLQEMHQEDREPEDYLDWWKR